ncbi:MAG: carbohydrate kinase [Granulosicoccus sp.]|nr:carbohydrate kinase [Granulosicoccus sp.]
MFLCCGDALYDLFVGESEHNDDVKSAVTLSGNVGGSPMNVAAGLARLGHHSHYFTKLSSDLFGRRMRRYLDHNKVDCSLSLNTDLNTTLAIVETNDDGSANYVFYTDNTADVSIAESELPATLSEDLRVVHFGSYSTAVEPTGGSLLALAQRETKKRIISYDPNLRPTIEPDVDKWRAVFAGLASTANLIKASDEDIETLLGKNREEQFVADCFSHGAELVFITRGPDGASGFKPDGQTVQVPGVAVSVVDTVGAGDTFQAATLHWLHKEGHLAGANSLVGDVDLEASMAFAIKAAALTCTRSGADLPYLSELN